MPWGFVVVAACSPQADPSPRLAGPLAALPCSDELQSTLVSWGAATDTYTVPAPESLEVQYRFPTAALGVWVLVAADPLRTRATLVGPDRVLTKDFAPDCRAELTEERNPAGLDGRPAFTDADLRKAVEEADADGMAGVAIYVWSPHMPLSVDGYGEISTAAWEHRLELVPVLHPGSEEGFARAEARRAGIPARGLRQAASVELAFRDAHVHAPSIVLFRRGQVSATLPGYRTAEGYRAFLTEFVSTE